MSQLLDVIGSSIRAMIYTPPGRVLVACDLSSIEVWTVGWLTGCETINEIARQGRDPYKAFGEVWLGIPYDEIDKATRTLCKPPTLGSGYRLSAGKQTGPDEFIGLMAYSRSMGVEMTQEQAEHATKVYRETYVEVPMFWRRWEECAFRCITEREEQRLGSLVFRMERDFMTIELPSGRKLWYHKPELRKVKAPWTDREGNPCWVTNVTYWGKSQYTNQWQRLATHGGKGLEQASQGLARDILVHGMRLFSRSTSDRSPIIGHVHDEAIVETEGGFGEEVLHALETCMTVTPEWVPGMVLSGSGYVSRRYRKD